MEDITKKNNTSQKMISECQSFLASTLQMTDIRLIIQICTALIPYLVLATIQANRVTVTFIKGAFFLQTILVYPTKKRQRNGVMKRHQAKSVVFSRRALKKVYLNKKTNYSLQSRISTTSTCLFDLNFLFANIYCTKWITFVCYNLHSALQWRSFLIVDDININI